MKSQIRGYLNNNPGNIEKNNDKFQGEVLPSRDKRFKQFQSMAYGYRAMFVILHTYLTKYQRNTIEKIIKAWAPPNENHTQGYIDSVAKWSGVPKNKLLTEHSVEDYINIVEAMSRMENGIEADMADVKRGLVLQNRIR